MDLTFPSEISPATPPFRMRLPAGWEPRPHATAAGFAVDTRSPEGFTVNLVVLVSRVIGDATLDELVDAAHAAPANARYGARELGRQRTRIAGNDAVLSVVTLEQEDLPFPIFQAQAALLLAGDDGISHLVHAYATCPSALSDRYAAAFRAMFATLTPAA